MVQFDRLYQLWQATDTGNECMPLEFDTLQEALTADRVNSSDDWYVTQRLTPDQIEDLVKKEMEGHPVVRPDPLDKLKQTYQLWNRTVGGGYILTSHQRLLDALKAPRPFDDWYVTQVIAASPARS